MNATDPQMRAALLPALRATRPDALFVQEWGVDYRLVADVAAIGTDRIEAWEIKSAADSTARLPRQVPLYSSLFDRCTIVTVPKHLRAVLSHVPVWWGIVLVDEAGLVSEERPAMRNAEARTVRCLWGAELTRLAKETSAWEVAAEVLRRAHREQVARHGGGVTWRAQRPGKRTLLEALEQEPVEAMAPRVCAMLRARADWRRDDGLHVQRDQRRINRERLAAYEAERAANAARWQREYEGTFSSSGDGNP